jgi:phage baseplate assembly protein W
MPDSIAGLSFPFRIDPTTGGVSWSFGTDKLRQNIRLIIGTRYGERPMLRDFGTRVHQLVHDPNDAVLADLLKQQVQEALLNFEPRVLVTQAQVVQSEAEVRMVLDYVQTSAPVADQLVLPLR